MTIHEWVTPHGSKVQFHTDRNRTETHIDFYDADPEEAIFGGDRLILEAARVSRMADESALTTMEKDKKLLSYLWKNGHWSCFEHTRLRFTVVTDLRIAMQMDTHRTLTKNRYSRRYSSDWVEFCTPQWRVQNTEGNKQGSEQPMKINMAARASDDFQFHCERAVRYYNKWIERGMAREQAAYFLPTGVLTATFYTVDLRNLINFIKQRSDHHAQKEIQDISNILRDYVIPMVCPWVWELMNGDA